ncbi:MarR family transcriptional regulator [Nocardioides sp. YIM 152588]|uniref:MarR family winged helix-turn-helix transcriptional regulator n=1 Tax=Nocardioides sp. YIM 152588 TaxID=3158259 RepID=UPI0032E3C9CC
MTDSRREGLMTALEAEVGVLLRRARRVIAERSREIHPDLPGPAFLMLGYVREHGPVRASAVGCAFHLDKATISRQVQQLVELGLVDRRPDPDDGRATLLTITAEADRRLRAVNDDRRKRLDERLDEWSDADLADFVDRLGRYNALLSPDDEA